VVLLPRDYGDYDAPYADDDRDSNRYSGFFNVRSFGGNSDDIEQKD
jgi:hypothetical protein